MTSLWKEFPGRASLALGVGPVGDKPKYSERQSKTALSRSVKGLGGLHGLPQAAPLLLNIPVATQPGLHGTRMRSQGSQFLFCDKLKERLTPGKLHTCLLGKILEGCMRRLLGSSGSLSAETLPDRLSGTTAPLS